MTGAEESSFFEFGRVRLDMLDRKERQMSISIVAPFCLIQSATPILLGHGLMDEFLLHNPLAVWMPPIGIGAFKDMVRQPHPDVAVQATNIVNQHISKLLTAFREVSQAMEDPDNLIPMLPIGTYVQVRYRSKVDDFATALSKLEEERTTGIPEMRYAMAEVLAFVLTL